MGLEAALRSVNECFGTSYSCLNEDQKEIIMDIVGDIEEKKDYIVQLPTGRGKTLILQLLPFLVTDSAVLIVAPTDAIILDFLTRFGESRIELTSQCLSDFLEDKELDSVTKLKSRNFKYLVTQPETLFTDNGVKFIKRLHDVLRFVAIDEAHCVLFWGASDFRPAFLDLSKLRSLLPQAKFIACTATLTESSRKDVANLLGLLNVQAFVRKPDRQNIFLCVCERPKASSDLSDDAASVEHVVKPLITALKDNPIEPKKIVYTNLNWSGYLHDLANRILGPDNSQVCQYHAPQSKEKKKEIVADVKKKTPESTYQLIFATEAFSMGIHSPDIRECIHIGPPNSLEIYAQEFGRIGRDGEPAVSTIFHNDADIGGNRKYLEESMREYIGSKRCRRQLIHEHFMGKESEFQPIQPSCKCCDNCKRECDCDECLCNLNLTTLSLDNTAGAGSAMNLVSSETLNCCTESLFTYFNQENALCDFSSQPELYTGLTHDLASQLPMIYLSTNCELTPDSLLEEYPYLDLCFCENIAAIIRAYRDN